MKMRSAVPVLIVVLLAGFWVHAQVRDYRPVTEATLRNPAAGDWLHWRRTDSAWGYSPLDQINRQNASQLQLAWSWAMDDTGAQEAAPLVHDGVMYLPSPRGVVQALDGATGDLIWEYRPDEPASVPQRSLRGNGCRADGYSASCAAASRASGRRRKRHRTRHSTKPRDLRRPDLRHHRRCPHCRARRA